MKNERQDAIIQLIENKICLTQQDLIDGLNEMGFNVTQSTISRDIKKLKLVKSRDENGNYRYIIHTPKLPEISHPFSDIFTRAVISVNYAMNNVVVKCNPGLASGACVAIDDIFGDMMLGSLAGDDTIIIVTASESESKLLCESLNKLF